MKPIISYSAPTSAKTNDSVTVTFRADQGVTWSVNVSVESNIDKWEKLCRVTFAMPDHDVTVYAIGTNATGESTEKSASIYCSGVNQLPSVTISTNQPGKTPTTISFSAGVSDPDNSGGYGYLWNFSAYPSPRFLSGGMRIYGQSEGAGSLEIGATSNDVTWTLSVKVFDGAHTVTAERQVVTLAADSVADPDPPPTPDPDPGPDPGPPPDVADWKLSAADADTLITKIQGDSAVAAGDATLESAWVGQMVYWYSTTLKVSEFLERYPWPEIDPPQLDWEPEMPSDEGWSTEATSFIEVGDWYIDLQLEGPLSPSITSRGIEMPMCTPAVFFRDRRLDDKHDYGRYFQADLVEGVTEAEGIRSGPNPTQVGGRLNYISPVVGVKSGDGWVAVRGEGYDWTPDTANLDLSAEAKAYMDKVRKDHEFPSTGWQFIVKYEIHDGKLVMASWWWHNDDIQRRVIKTRINCYLNPKVFNLETLNTEPSPEQWQYAEVDGLPGSGVKTMRLAGPLIPDYQHHGSVEEIRGKKYIRRYVPAGEKIFTWAEIEVVTEEITLEDRVTDLERRVTTLESTLGGYSIGRFEA